VKVTVYVYCDAQPTANSTVKFVWQETFLVKLWSLKLTRYIKHNKMPY